MHIHANHPLNLFYFLIFIISVIIIFLYFRDSLKMETRISENLQKSLLLKYYLNFQFLFKSWSQFNYIFMYILRSKEITSKN